MLGRTTVFEAPDSGWMRMVDTIAETNARLDAKFTVLWVSIG
jgi:hypothetical protein